MIFGNKAPCLIERITHPEGYVTYRTTPAGAQEGVVLEDDMQTANDQYTQATNQPAPTADDGPMPGSDPNASGAVDTTQDAGADDGTTPDASASPPDMGAPPDASQPPSPDGSSPPSTQGYFAGWHGGHGGWGHGGGGWGGWHGGHGGGGFGHWQEPQQQFFQPDFGGDADDEYAPMPPPPMPWHHHHPHFHGGHF